MEDLFLDVIDDEETNEEHDYYICPAPGTRSVKCIYVPEYGDMITVPMEEGD